MHNDLTLIEFSKLYLQFQPRFLTIARRYVRDAMVAEDLVADSFTSFWQCKDTLDDQVNIPAYILTIVKNKCLNYLSSEQRRLHIQKNIHTNNCRMLEHNINALKLCDPHKIFADEVTEIFNRELASMPELTRLIFEASRFENKTYSDIALEYGISVRKVTSEIQRALSLLRKALKDYLPFISISFIINHLLHQ